MQTATTDPAEAQRRYDEQMKQMAGADAAAAATTAKAADAQKARELTAEDRAKRCQDARQRYESYMNARRLYEPGDAEGERRYLSTRRDRRSARGRQADDGRILRRPVT